MIEETKVIEILEFIQKNNGKKADYSMLCNSLTELTNYLHYIHDLGYISNIPTSFTNGNSRKHIAQIKPVNSFQEFEHFAAIRITAKGNNLLEESRKSGVQKIVDEIKNSFINEFVKKFYWVIFTVLGIVLTLTFQYFLALILKR